MAILSDDALRSGFTALPVSVSISVSPFVRVSTFINAELLPAGFDIGCLLCPRNQLQHQAGDRQQRANCVAGILFLPIAEREPLAARAPWANLNLPWFIRIAIVKPHEDLLGQTRRHRPATFNPRRFPDRLRLLPDRFAADVTHLSALL